jgi:surfeit locus 1 family protein
MNILKIAFNRRWWWTTLLAIAGVAVLARLGIWQLDRLDQRRAFNEHLITQWDAAPLDLASNITGDPLPEMEYRSVIVSGEYDFEHEIAIKNIVRYSRLGYYLLTPLKISGSEQVALINRGWVPADQYTAATRGFFEEDGFVELEGIIRVSSELPDVGGLADPTLTPGERRNEWFNINIPEITKQMPYELLPVYVQQGPGDATPEGMEYPIRIQPKLEISEGSHQSYAIQWFTFAVILAIGYPIFLSRETMERDA